MKNRPRLLKDLVGQTITLIKQVRTVGGNLFSVGERFKIISVHRGKLDVEHLTRTHGEDYPLGVRNLHLADCELVEPPADVNWPNGTPQQQSRFNKLLNS